MADIQKIQVDGKVYDVRDEASRLLIEKIQKEMPASLSQGDNGCITLVNSAGAPIGNILNVSGGGNTSVTEVTSPDQISKDSPDGWYFVEGENESESGTPIHYYDSLDAVPADLPDGSFVAVPSAGGGGGDLPPATAADNGKFVQVVNGAYGLVALDDVSVGGV